MVTTKVIGIQWCKNKNGEQIGIIMFEPIVICNANITRVGASLKYITVNGIGLDAVIDVERYDDVIPYIRKVLLTSNNTILPEDV